MTTPDEPQNPYGANPPQEPEQPPQPPYGAPQPPQYGAPQPPQYGAPQAPQYPAAPQSPQYPAAPQYGAPQAPQYPAAPQYGVEGYGVAPVSPTAKNSLAVWSLVTGIVSLLFCGLILGIVAIVLGRNAKQAVARGEANNGGLATAGQVLGGIAIVIWAVLIIARVANS
jgi:hypothetical protein